MKHLFVYFDVLGTFQNSNFPRLFPALIFLHKKQLEKKKYESGTLGNKRA
jgi:hypothetical protein